MFGAYIEGVLCGLDAVSYEAFELLPEETPSLRRSDLVVKAELEDGEELLVIIELSSRWERGLPLRFLEYRTRHKLSEGITTRSFIVLLRPSGRASEVYRDEEVEFRFRVIKVYEMDAREVLESNQECLFPFVPLMKGGESRWEEAERRIYEGDFDRSVKADLLTGMAILSGLISVDLPVRLIQRRRDIMIESAAYEIIKKEGFEEGVEQGIQQGIQQGLVQEGQEMVIEAVEERFGTISESLVREIKGIKERELLKRLHRMVFRVRDLEEFKEQLQRVRE